MYLVFVVTSLNLGIKATSHLFKLFVTTIWLRRKWISKQLAVVWLFDKVNTKLPLIYRI